MKCPACGSAVRKKRYHDLIIDECESCKGLWFDERELGEFLQQYVEEHPDVASAPAGNGAQRRDSSAAALQCPSCSADMRETNYAYDSNVFVDRCAQCGGVWTDRRGVRQLAAYVRGNPKMDKLGAALAQDIQKRQNLQDVVDGIKGLSVSPGLWVFMPKIILPLDDDVGRRTIPFTTLGLILANALVFLFTPREPEAFMAFCTEYGFIPARFLQGEAIYTVLSCMFLHIGLLHLLGNALFLWIFGDNIEDEFGHGSFLGFYIFCGLMACGAHLALYPHSTRPIVGASGAIAGTMGAYLVLHPGAYIRTFIINTVVPIPALVYLGVWIGMQFLFATVNYSAGTTGGAGYAAHAGGFVAGLGIAIMYKVLRRPRIA